MVLKGLYYDYVQDKKTLYIRVCLRKEGAVQLARILPQFLKEKGAQHYELIFYSSDPKGAVPVTSQMLKKAKSPAPNFICPPLVSSFTSTGKTGESYIAGTYKLEDTVGKDFWKWCESHLFDFGIHELNIFDEENKKMGGFWDEGIILYDITKTEADKIKKQLKPLENNVNFWKDQVQYWRLYIGLHDPKTEKERGDYRVYSTQQFLQDIIAGKAIPQGVNFGFDFKRFKKIMNYKFLVESIPNAPYNEQWKPEEVLKLFKDLRDTLKEKVGKLPAYYQMDWISGNPCEYGYAPAEQQDMGEFKGTIYGKKWTFRWGRETAIAKSTNGKIIDLTKGNGKFKVGEEYEATDTKGDKLKFKIVKKNVLEMYDWLFEKIYRICNYAKENNYKMSVIV